MLNFYGDQSVITLKIAVSVGYAWTTILLQLASFFALLISVIKHVASHIPLKPNSKYLKLNSLVKMMPILHQTSNHTLLSCPENLKVLVKIFLKKGNLWLKSLIRSHWINCKMVALKRSIIQKWRRPIDKFSNLMIRYASKPWTRHEIYITLPSLSAALNTCPSQYWMQQLIFSKVNN